MASYSTFTLHYMEAGLYGRFLCIRIVFCVYVYRRRPSIVNLEKKEPSLCAHIFQILPKYFCIFHIFNAYFSILSRLLYHVKRLKTVALTGRIFRFYESKISFYNKLMKRIEFMQRRISFQPSIWHMKKIAVILALSAFYGFLIYK